MKLLIIAPFAMHKNLLSFYRKEDPFNDVKIVSKESLIGDYLGKCKEGVINHLMNKFDYSYDNAKRIIPFIPYINESINDLYKIKLDLINNNLITKNDYLKQFFLDKKIIIYGYSKKDQELNNLIKAFSLEVKYRFNEVHKLALPLINYETSIDEIFYTLNKIASLIDEGVSINDIYIYCPNKDYEFYFEKFSDDFGFKVEFDDSYPLFNSSLGTAFLSLYKENKDIILSLEIVKNDCKDEELYKQFEEIINKYSDPNLDFEKQLDLFKGVLKDHRFKNQKYKNAICLITNPIFIRNAHIFVMCFAQGYFPNTIKDNTLLNDEIKKGIGKNTSLEESEIINDQLLDFLCSDNYFYFSYANRNMKERFYVSSYETDLGLNKVSPSFPNIIYSKDMRDLYYLRALDLKKYFLETTPYYYGLSKIADIEYDNYDNSFSGVSAFNDHQYLKYSYSQISTFYQCPFKYYLSKVLNIDEFTETFHTKFGNVTHKVFELMHDENFDFDDVYDKAVIENNFKDEDLLLVNSAKDKIHEAVEAAKVHEQYMKNPRFFLEEEVNVPLTKYSSLVGKIDKTILLDNKYLAIVDYKTGSDSFNSKYIEYGDCLQLPTYCYLVSTYEKFKDYQLLGIFINNVFDKALTYQIKENDLFNPYYKLKGKIIPDISVIQYLDESFFDSGKPSSFINSIYIKKDGSLSAHSTGVFASKEEFKYYIEVARKLYLEADQRIRNNGFSINPLYIDDNKNGCKYCNYKDICFLKEYQRRYPDNLNEENEEDDSDE